ncbi:hypothetical protein FMM05_15565 [Flavobacterium zepuense]|uniref:5'-Nucleotidase C-terminal domain-containing protein n=1 Tax=Flavobacterium zepuense TaxID=2593302 RepID=A0A552UXZ4_9FLAO|nr:5'-nucleotidase [Flavobacterium zepuense]TRW23107.1 hypothetical protein FMM05_15565 [Flavobacterium zepuense]
MRISKKYNTYRSGFVLFLTTALLISCGAPAFYATAIEGKKLPISAEYSNNHAIEDYVAPYRTHINKDLDSVLVYCPETMDKTNTINGWQTTIGNLLADVTFDKAATLIKTRENRNLDICLLNHGGIRSVIAKGPVTARTAFEVMPFENSLMVVALKGEQVMEMAQYIAREKKPHPLAGMLIVLDENDSVKTVTIQGKPLQPEKIYNIATSDYLVNGGDSMTFLGNAVATYDLTYKLRDVYIDYFKEVDTLPIIRTERIVTQKP